MKKFMKKLVLPLFMGLFILCSSASTFEPFLQQEISLFSSDDEEDKSNPYTRF